MLQWLQKRVAFIMKGHTGLGQICRIFWVPSKDCIIEKCMRLSKHIIAISSLPHLATLARADSELCPSTSRQADTEQSVDIGYPSALMDSDDDKMLIDDSLPLSPNTSVSCASHDLILWWQPNTSWPPPLCFPMCCLPNSGKVKLHCRYIISTLYRLCIYHVIPAFTIC